MMHNQMLPNHEEEWFKFFQMVQQQLQEPSVDGSNFSLVEDRNYNLPNYIDGVIAHVKTLKGKKALESAGIEAEDLLSLLRETKEYLSYSRNSLNCYLKPLERYCELKEKSNQMSGLSQPQNEDPVLQGIRTKIAESIQARQGTSSLGQWADDQRLELDREAPGYADKLEQDRNEFLSEPDVHIDIKQEIAEHYDCVIRRFRSP